MGENGDPVGDLSLRTVAMPADTNPAGHIFGGWLMSLMDLSAGMAAGTIAKGRVATKAVSDLTFLQPCMSATWCAATPAWRAPAAPPSSFMSRPGCCAAISPPRMKVTAAEFVMVALDAEGHPRPL